MSNINGKSDCDFATKKKVTIYNHLDARRIARLHGYSPGHEFAIPLLNGSGIPTGSMAVVSVFEDRLEVQTAIDALLHTAWPIRMKRTSLNSRGGWRWWFECPTCGRGCAVVYMRAGKPPSCRKCMNLAYPSQSEGGFRRAIRRTHKIYRRLGWDPARPDTWRRPKGMWHRTFLMLLGEMNSSWEGVNAALNQYALIKRYSENH